MSLFVNAAPFEENNSIIENKKTKKSYIKEATKRLNYLQYLLMMMILWFSRF